MKVDIEVLTDTLMHVAEVQERLEDMIHDLRKRGLCHDRTKFQELEFDTFCRTRPRFKGVKFGTPDYDAVVEEAREAVEHHHHHNRHHTTYYDGGIEDMNLLDVLEMLADWRAAARRSKGQSFEESLPKAFERYNVPEVLREMIGRTIQYLGW